jgi:hypothetical protein
MYYYCERTTDGILSEPLNSLTNLAFIIISFLIFKKFREEKFSIIFSVLIFSIGVSSLLFHSVPNRITGTMDMFFILIFILMYLFSINNFIFKHSKITSLLFSLFAPILYYYLGNILKQNVPFLGDSSFYIIILLHLYIIYFYTFFKAIQSRLYLMIANLIFTLSILFRALDIYACEFNLYGTHFVWHVLNSFVLFMLIMFFYKNNLRKTSSPKIPS